MARGRGDKRGGEAVGKRLALRQENVLGRWGQR
jgi:hypothetical protein